MVISDEDSDLPGDSLWRVASEPERDRTVFSEYHAAGSRHAAFMIVDRRFKYIHYTFEAAQVFDLENDPDELNDLAKSADHQILGQALEKHFCLMKLRKGVEMF